MTNPNQRIKDINDSFISLITIKEKDYVDINYIYSNTTFNNKWPAIFMVFLMIGGYYLNDIVFTRNVAKITSDIKSFIKDINYEKLLYLLGPYVLGLIMIYGSDRLFAHVIPRIKVDSINELVDKIIESLRTSKDKINVNDAMLHVKEFAGSAQFYKVIFKDVLPTLLVVINVVFSVIIYDLSSGVIIIIVLTFMLILTFSLELDNVKESCESDIADHVLFDEIHEILSNMDIIITSDTKVKEVKRISTLKEVNYQKNKNAKISIANTTFTMSFITLIAVFGINYLIYEMYKSNKISEEIFIGNVLLSIVFMNYYNTMLISIKNVMGGTGAFLELYDFFKKYVNITTDKNEMYKGPDLSIRLGDIEFRNLNIKYNNSKHVFDNFNYKFSGNSITGIIGEIGSGKSTLLKALAGLIPYEGTILVDGHNLIKRNYKSIVKNIAYIPQHPSLFNKSIIYNLKYGTDKSKKDIINLLKKLDLYDFFIGFPQGLDTIVGKGGNNLSGGQKQFVTIVRTLLQNKNIILLDEPSSSLDKNNKTIFMKLLSKIKQSKTIIVTTHDIQLFKIFDKVVNIDHLKKIQNKAY